MRQENIMSIKISGANMVLIVSFVLLHSFFLLLKIFKALRLLCHAVNLISSQQKCSHAIDLCHVAGHLARVSTNRLYVA